MGLYLRQIGASEIYLNGEKIYSVGTVANNIDEERGMIHRDPMVITFTSTTKNVLATEKFQNTDYDLPIVLGRTISNEVYLADLTRMPHLLIAGATGQGKSVGVNVILTSLIYKKHPSQLKFILAL